MKITEITESINFYDRFGHDTGAQTLPYTVEVRDRETGGKKLISVQAVSAADARERARDRGYRVVRVVSQDESVEEGIMDTLKGAAKEFTRDSLQKKIKQAWENTFWPKHIEPALNRIQIDGQPFRRMVLGEPRVIENDRSKNAILKQYTVNIVFPIDPQQWAGDEIKYLEAQLRDIEDGDWNPKVHGLGLVSFDQPMKSFQYAKGSVPDLVIPVRITSLDINRSLVGEQGVAEGTEPTEQIMDQSISDLVKDVLGTRPTSDWMQRWMAMSVDEKLALYQQLASQLD